ncbi:Uncharacterised protein [Yersinia enterocolitica]|nr:hypothetical protein CH48_3430 [Yersinia enterocolitica]KGA70338.1 hypothetical protein DJ61_1531 [Yersinia enterocolitica]CNF98390.1 Uncharacterised protein [Yersinia enterocolitica]CNG81197.1 Uncharacterised protein [Yersinia enterocolitica]CNH12872.1 Uncharacterised protein [Yersinia enterocolitica]
MLTREMFLVSLVLSDRHCALLVSCCDNLLERS